MPAAEDQPIPPLVTLTDAIADVDWFGKTFASPSFWTWKCRRWAVDGIPAREPREVELFEPCTGLSLTTVQVAGRSHAAAAVWTTRRAGPSPFRVSGVWRAALCLDWKQVH